MADEDRRVLAGRYAMGRRLGAGGTASVFLAEDRVLGRSVAIKWMRPGLENADSAARRFRREARITASLNHPNTVQLYDAVVDGADLFLVMEYVPGPNLAERMRDGDLSAAEVVAILRDIGAALDHAHRSGVVHRDVKPANILLDSRTGRAKLADLGIASSVHGTRMTGSGDVLGTPAYIAPELLDGRAATAAADIYELAAVAFEALSGHRLRDGDAAIAMAVQAVTSPPKNLRDVQPDAPVAAAGELARALSRDPAQRPGSCRELIAGLAAAYGVGGGRARPAAADVAAEAAAAGTAAAEAAQAAEAEPAATEAEPAKARAADAEPAEAEAEPAKTGAADAEPAEAGAEPAKTGAADAEPAEAGAAEAGGPETGRAGAGEYEPGHEVDGGPVPAPATKRIETSPGREWDGGPFDAPAIGAAVDAPAAGARADAPAAGGVPNQPENQVDAEPAGAPATEAVDFSRGGPGDTAAVPVTATSRAPVPGAFPEGVPGAFPDAFPDGGAADGGSPPRRWRWRGLSGRRIAAIGAGGAAVLAAALLATFLPSGSHPGAPHTARTPARSAPLRSKGPASPPAGRSPASPAFTPPAQAGNGPATSPVAAVRQFYLRAARHDYPDAWALAAPSYRQQLQGYDSFRATFANVLAIRFKEVRVTSRTGGTASVAISTVSKQTTETQYCSGTVTTQAAAANNWQVSQISIQCL